MGKKIEPSNTITCLTCEENPSFDCMKNMDQFKKHLAEVHQIEKFKGTRRAIMHADGREHFVWVYELSIEDGKVRAQQESIQLRHKNDMMRFT